MHPHDDSTHTQGLTRKHAQLLVERGETHWAGIRAHARGGMREHTSQEAAAAFAHHASTHRDAISLALVSHTWGLAQLIGCEPQDNAEGRGALLWASDQALRSERGSDLRGFIENGTTSVVLVDKTADPVSNIAAVALQCHEVLAENTTHQLVVMHEPVAKRLRELRFGLIDAAWEGPDVEAWTPTLSSLTLALASEHAREVHAGQYHGPRHTLAESFELAGELLAEV